MAQQVNLYTDDFKPVKVVMPLEHIVLASLGVILSLFIITVFLNTGINERAAALEARHEKVDALADRVAELEKEVNLRKKDESLVRANERLSEKLAAREEMVDILDSLVIQGDEGFSTLMEALSRQTIESLWLTRIEISGAGEDIALTGLTRSAEAVPEYLQKLREEQGFLGRSFTLFELSTDEQEKGQIGFQLRSKLSGNQVAIVNAESSAEAMLEGEN